MSDSEPTEPNWTAGERLRDGAGRSAWEVPSRVVEFCRAASCAPPAVGVVSFDRHELSEILAVYGRKVADGEWRDYAIDFSRERAVFSIYRRTSEVPLFRVEKDPGLARRQGAYSVVTSAGQILKRGHDLKRVVAALDKPMKLVVS